MITKYLYHFVSVERAMEWERLEKERALEKQNKCEIPIDIIDLVGDSDEDEEEIKSNFVFYRNDAKNHFFQIERHSIEFKFTIKKLPSYH